MRILYVEDNMANVSLVRRVARNDEVINYIDGEEALRNFERDDPDLVLMDIQLAGRMTGLDVVRELRSKGYTVPIIAVTAYAMVGDRERCIDAGCDDYIAKPLPIPHLVQLFEERRVALKSKPPRIEPKPADAPAPTEATTDAAPKPADAPAPTEATTDAAPKTADAPAPTEATTDAAPKTADVPAPTDAAPKPADVPAPTDAAPKSADVPAPTEATTHDIIETEQEAQTNSASADENPVLSLEPLKAEADNVDQYATIPVDMTQIEPAASEAEDVAATPSPTEAENKADDSSNGKDSKDDQIEQNGEPETESRQL